MRTAMTFALPVTKLRVFGGIPRSAPGRQRVSAASACIQFMQPESGMPSPMPSSRVLSKHHLSSCHQAEQDFRL